MIICFQIGRFFYGGKVPVGLRERIGEWLSGGIIACMFEVDGLVFCGLKVAVHDYGAMCQRDVEGESVEV